MIAYSYRLPHYVKLSLVSQKYYQKTYISRSPAQFLFKNKCLWLLQSTSQKQMQSKSIPPFPFSGAENAVVNYCQLKPQPNLILNDLDFQTSTATWCSRKNSFKRSKHLFPSHTLVIICRYYSICVGSAFLEGYVIWTLLWMPHLREEAMMRYILWTQSKQSNCNILIAVFTCRSWDYCCIRWFMGQY